MELVSKTNSNIPLTKGIHTRSKALEVLGFDGFAYQALCRPPGQSKIQKSSVALLRA